MAVGLPCGERGYLDTVTTGEPSAPPPVAGRYALVRTLGAGGMGTVWLARDLLLGRDVAVKEVTGQGERVLLEARAAARIVHPNVVTVYDVVAHDDRQWIVMQHVESRTLADVIALDGALPPARVAEIGLDLLAALRAAHASGVLHRDVKPGNVLLDAQGRAYLADFGIASAEGDATLTGAGVLVGAPSFMAPERIQGLQSGPESDFWSLGVTLYAAVEGAVPFDRGDALATMTAVLTDPVPPPASAGPLGPLLVRLLDKDPAGRPAAEDIFSALTGLAVAQATLPLTKGELLAGGPTAAGSVVAGPAPAGSLPSRPVLGGPTAVEPVPVRRRRAPMAVGAVALAAAVGALLFFLRPAPQTVVPEQTPAAPQSSATTTRHIDPTGPVNATEPTTRAATTTPTTTTTTTTGTATTTTAPPTTTTTTTSTTPPASTTATTTDQTSVSPTS
ncbi:serine/threonine-protein kinase [Kutzneria sp. CA-103260]|uniref:serine/threonine-protein kinase n=1 Tax=Kutzneria sp. CA-103260 TaxID=2802641 RepID=UPI001BEE68B0|nr:serine/threonine-protein kinase [Kutzneria sp. CA-103260]QUQ62471.1 Serine/threonine-protein kinase PknD [Kutzneria sp. CA-103260]